MIKIGCMYKYALPAGSTFLPEYVDHDGALVTVVKAVPDDDPLNPSDPMYQIVAEDGWVGNAWEYELKEVGP